MLYFAKTHSNKELLKEKFKQKIANRIIWRM